MRMYFGGGGCILEMWCSCIFDSICFSLFLSAAELLSLSIVVLQLCYLTASVPILYWIKDDLHMRIWFLPGHFSRTGMLDIFKSWSFKTTKCVEKCAGVGSTEVIVFALFFYARFGSPNIHLCLFQNLLWHGAEKPLKRSGRWLHMSESNLL